MARIRIPYFVDKPGKPRREGGVLVPTRRYYWQPNKELRALGWPAERLPADEAAAIARAQQINAQVAAWRAGNCVLPAATPAADGVGPADEGRHTPPGAAIGGRRPAKPIQVNSLAHLIRLYRASDDFLRLRDKTRRAYLQNLQALEDWAGDAPAAAIGPARVQALYKAFKTRTPAKARALVGMLRILFAFALRTEFLPKEGGNAAQAPKLQGAPQSGRLWPLDAVALFVEVADRMGWHSVGSMVLTNHWIGQRQADIIAMQRTDYRGGRFYLTQAKTGAKVAVPHSPWVEARIEAELARQAARGIRSLTHLFVCETTGQPWKEDHFRHVFAEIRAAAAEIWPAFSPSHDELVDQAPVPLLDLQFMHLRHTAVTELAIAGCEVPEIAGVTGHTVASVEQILRRYLVRTARLAAAATGKRLAASADVAALFPAPAEEQKR